MEMERYELISSHNGQVYEFISEGRNGRILKSINFVPIRDNFYNLALGDKDIESGEINYKVISNNGDRDKVLATVVESVYNFLSINKKSIVHISGSTVSRTRLYQMAINQNYEALSRDFLILGKLNEQIIGFKKDIRFHAFLVLSIKYNEN